MDKFKDDLDVTINYANPWYHVPGVYLNNRTVKEVYLAQYHILPFQNIPKVMIRYFSFEVVINLSYFSFKGSLSPHYGPQTILDQQTLDYNKFFTIKFGSFFQSNNDNNTKN